MHSHCRRRPSRPSLAPENKTWREPAARQGTARSAIATHNAAPLKGLELASGLSTSVVGNPRDDFGNCYRAAHFDADADSVAVLTGVIGAHQPKGLQIDRFNLPVSGWYRVKFSTWSLRWERNKVVPPVRGLVQNFEVFSNPPFQEEKGQWQMTQRPGEVKRLQAIQNSAWIPTSDTRRPKTAAA